MQTERRLAAILAADVVGSSRLTEADEAYALPAIHAALHDVLISSAIQNGGRLIKTMGDGALIEFASPVAAVTCAGDVQTTLTARAGAIASERRVLLRIGINLGDVVVASDGDLYGDGINVAARLEGIAAAGGIAISGSVHDHLTGKTSVDWQDHGEVSLKGISRPVRVFKTVDGNRTLGRHVPPLPDRPSLAVLPFINMSGDPEQEYFADGLVEDLITALSRVKQFFVIARNSSFTYKGKAVDMRQIGRELGVRYVLEGSVRKGGGRIRITCQLIEAETGRHVWADRFDGEVDNLFELQDQVSESVVGIIEPHISAAEIIRSRAKPTENLNAYDLYLRALANFHSLSKESSDEACRLLNAAISEDPTFAQAKALLALSLVARVAQGWAAEEGRTTGERLAREALALDRNDPMTLRCAGQALVYLARDFAVGSAAVARAITLNPNSAPVLGSSGWVNFYVGNPSLGIEHLRRAMRLSPLDPTMWYFQSGLAHCLLLLDRNNEALEAALAALSERQTLPSLLVKAVALVDLGRLQEAAAVVDVIKVSYPSITGAILLRFIVQPDPAYRARYVENLTRAGLPVE